VVGHRSLTLGRGTDLLYLSGFSRFAFSRDGGKWILPWLVILVMLPVRGTLAQDDSALECRPEFEPAGPGFDFTGSQTETVPVPGDVAVGEVIYTRLPIFDEDDPRENNFLFRWANRIHVLTREQTLAQELLFTSGEVYDGRLLQESARILRRQGFVHDAAIRPVSQCGGVVDVEVITKDNWSLTPNLSFDRQGGDNTYSFGLSESNLSGWGKSLAFTLARERDRRTRELKYRDPNVSGTRLRNYTAIIDSDEGELYEFDLGLPFYSLQSRNAWSVNLKNEERQDEQFYRGREVNEVIHEIDDYSVDVGLSGGLIEGTIRRWRFGYRYEQHRFRRSPDLPPPDLFPRDRRLSYPFITFALVEDDFVTAFNLDQLYRTEDLHLGRDLSLTLGFATDALGSDQNRLVFRGRYGNTLNYDRISLWQHHLRVEGFWNETSGQSEDVLISYENRYFRRQADNRSFFASFNATWSHNLNSHRQVLLGGASGARAFKNEFQTGDRKVLLTLEERVYSDLHLLNLIRVGAALFIDVGRAWAPGADDGLQENWLANIGFGLRLASSKAASARLAHLDFAFPLTNRDDPAVDTVQVAFTVKGSF